MLRGKIEGEMVLLLKGSSVKESPEDKQTSATCVKKAHLCGGGGFPYFL